MAGTKLFFPPRSRIADLLNLEIERRREASARTGGQEHQKNFEVYQKEMKAVLALERGIMGPPRAHLITNLGTATLEQFGPTARLLLEKGELEKWLDFAQGDFDGGYWACGVQEYSPLDVDKHFAAQIVPILLPLYEVRLGDLSPPYVW
jgi:hypothetical protein